MALKVELELDDGSFSSGMLRAGESLTKFESKAGNVVTSIRKMEDSSKSFLSTLRDVTVVLGLTHQALGMVETATTSWVREIVGVNAEFERMVTIMKTLSVAQDPLKEATESVTQLRNMAKDAPFSLNAIHTAFVRLNAAGLDPMAGGMKALVDAVAAFGGGDSELNRASLAMQEMAGKGVVQMKELRNQLMMAIPSAAKLMARSVGESYGQMMSDIHTGTVDAKSTIQALNLEFERSFGGAAVRQMQTFNGQIGRTALLLQDLAIINVGKPMSESGLPNANGFFEVIKKQAVDFNEFLASGTAKGLGDTLGQDLTAIVSDIRSAIDWVVKFREEIVAAGEAMAMGFGVKLAIGGIGGLIGILGSIKTELTFIKAQWTTAFDAVEINSATAALKRQAVAERELREARQAAGTAHVRAGNSQSVADEMRRLADTQPSAGSRTLIEQNDLEAKQLNAKKTLNSEIAAAELASMKTVEAAKQNIKDQRVRADAAQARADEQPHLSGGVARTELAQANLNKAATRAQEELHRDMIELTNVKLQAEADAIDRVTVAQVRYNEALRVARATPETVARTDFQQNEAELTAIRAQATAKRDAVAANASALGVAAASERLAVAEAESGTSALARSGRNLIAFLPAIATGFMGIAVAAPIAMAAVGFLSEYFDVFNHKAKEAWENLEHYGAASREAAESGDPFVKQQQAKLDSLRKTAEWYQNAKNQQFGTLSANPDGEGDSRSWEQKRAAAKIDYAEQEKKMSDLRIEERKNYAEGDKNDAKKNAKPYITSMDETQMKEERDYNRQANKDADEYGEKYTKLANEKKSTSLAQAEYEQLVHDRNMSYYDEQITAIKEEAALSAKVAETGDFKQKNANIEVQADAEKRILDLRRQQLQTQNQVMGLQKNVKPVDDKALIEKAQTELEKLKESIGGYSAGIRGADYEAERLYETWTRMERANGDSEFVRNLILQIKEAKKEADDLNKIMEGDHKLDKALDETIDKLKEGIFKDKFGKNSESEQLMEQLREGHFAGHGGETVEQQRLTALRQQIISNTETAKTFGATLEQAIGGTLVSKINNLNDALRGTGDAMKGAGATFAAAASQGGNNPLLALLGGANGINVPTGNPTLNGSIMGGAEPSPNWADGIHFGNAGPGSAQTSANDKITSEVKNALQAMEATLGTLTVNSTTEGDHAKNSLHYKGQAVDISTSGMTDAQYTAAVTAGVMAGFRGIGISNTHLHLDMEGTAGDKVRAFDDEKNSHIVRAGRNSDQWTQYANSLPVAAPSVPTAPSVPKTPSVSSALNLSTDQGLKMGQIGTLEAQKKMEDANLAIREMMDEFKKVFGRRDFEADGVGTNRAKALEKIHDGGLDSSAHSIDPANPAFKDFLAMADKADVAAKAYADHEKLQSAAKASSESMTEKSQKINDDLANLMSGIKSGGKGVSEALIRLREDLDKNVAKQRALYKDPNDPHVVAAEKLRTDTMSSGESLDSVQKLDALNKKVEAAKQATMTEAERDAEVISLAKEGYDRDVANFHGSLEQKAEFEAKANKDLAYQEAALAAKSPIGKEMQAWGDVSKNVQSDMAGAMSSALDGVTSMIMTHRANWMGIADGIEKSLLSTALKGATSGLLGGTGLTGMFTSVAGGGASKLGGEALGGGGGKGGVVGPTGPMQPSGIGGIMGSLGAMFGIHHSGDIVGAAGVPTRFAAWEAFHGAPRFHTGGVIGSDEVPIITQKGEGVFTKAQMKAMTIGGSGGGHAINVNNNITLNAAGGSAEQNADLARQVGDHVERVARETVVSELMNQMRPGNMLAQ